ncbi:NAD(P)H-dependent oxidoreductase subunit E [bacterium]|nr:NAD(P)H-dependent oxidoreductase subunit E [bacterium]
MANKENTKKSGSVMVVGGGIAGIQSSLDLAESGFKVYLLEESPAIGGTMAQLDKTFPTNDCAMCVISPKLVGAGRHLNIELITNAEVVGLSGEAGNFTVQVKKKPRYVDEDKCTGCGACTQNCPVVNVLQMAEEPDIQLSTESLLKVTPILDKYRGQKGNLMPILQQINQTFNYLPADVLTYISIELDVRLSDIYNIASFYNSFSLTPRGRHTIKICMGTTCYVKGGERLYNKVRDEFGIENGETSEDMRFTIESVACLGCCGLAPAIMVDDEVYGKVKVSNLMKILEKYK